MCAEYCTADGQLLPELKQLDPEMINRVLNDVVEDCQGISWDSIVGLKDVKDLIKKNMVAPMYYPHLFTVHPTSLALSARHSLYGAVSQRSVISSLTSVWHVTGS